MDLIVILILKQKKCGERKMNEKDKLIVFVNTDSPSTILGGRIYFYRLAESFYRYYKNSLLITFPGANLSLIESELTIPTIVLPLRAPKQILRQFEYIYRVLRLNIKPSVIISNQHTLAGYYLSKKSRSRHLYIMYDNFYRNALMTKLTDRLFHKLCYHTLKKSFFVTISEANWEGWYNRIGVIHSGYAMNKKNEKGAKKE
jgi:hypothetical protein